VEQVMLLGSLVTRESASNQAVMRVGFALIFSGRTIRDSRCQQATRALMGFFFDRKAI
jgi:hypothetical protein